jgi:hypothetical protein
MVKVGERLNHFKLYYYVAGNFGKLFLSEEVGLCLGLPFGFVSNAPTRAGTGYVGEWSSSAFCCLVVEGHKQEIYSQKAKAMASGWWLH